MRENPETKQDPFGLSNLDAPPVPEQAWAEIESALKYHNSRRQSMRWLATAAVLMLAVALYWQFPPSEQVHPAFTSSAGHPEPGINTTAEPEPGQIASIDSLVKLSQQLENNLRLLRQDVVVTSGQALIYQVELEDLVAQVDEAINQQPDSKALWAQRVNLLQDLNQLYQQQMRRDVNQLASL